jgi:hypothetical protein
MARRLLKLLIVTTIVAGFASTSFAGADVLGVLAGSTGFKAGPVTLHAGLQVKGSLDSNIYATPTGEVDDYISVLSPGILITMKTQRHKFDLGASSDTYYYSDNDDENFTAVTYKSAYALTSTNGIEFSISDTYMTSEDPRPEQNTPRRKEHYTNDIDGKVRYTFPAKKFAVEVFAKELHLQYDEDQDESSNRKDREIGLGIYYRVLPKTSLLIEYSNATKEYFDRIASDDKNDSRSNFYRLGIKWDASARMNGSIKVGYEERRYSDLDYDVNHTPAVDGNIQYKINKTTKIKAIVRFLLNETAYAGDPINFSKSYNYDHQEVGIGINSKFMNRFTIDLNANISNDEYENFDGGSKSTREDTIHNFTASFDYDFNKNISGGLSYTVKSKDSNDSNQDENKQVVSLLLRYVI